MGVLFFLKSKPTDEKLEYFKQKLIEHLKAQDQDTIEKGGFAVGTIREWNGSKYIKGADNKWRRYYNKETRGAKVSIKHLIKKVEAIDNAEGLMKLVLLHRDRFSDENGNPIPLVQKLSRHISERQGRIAPVGSEKPPERKESAGEMEEAREKEEKTESGGEEIPKKKRNFYEPGKPKRGQAAAARRKKPEDESSKQHKEFVKNRIKEERRRLSAAKSRYKKLVEDNKEKRAEGKLKPNEGMRLTMSELNADKNVKYHENSLAQLLDEAKQLGIDTEEWKKGPEKSEERKHRSRENTKENDDAKKNIIEKISAHGVEITPQEGKYLFATGPADDGYFIINGNLDYNAYDEIMAEAEKKGLKPPYHVYGNFETYQDKKNVDFHKLSETLLENKESEEEKHRNRSEAMMGNQNAKKNGPEDPPTEKRRKKEQVEEKKARKKAGMPEEKGERTSAMKDSTWNPKSEDYRYRDTGYIAGSRKEKAQAYIRRMAKDGLQVLNTSIDWQDIEENERIAEETITKQNLMGKPDWETLMTGGMKGNAGYLINEIYKTIASKPEKGMPESRFNFSKALDSIRGRMEDCKTHEDVIGVAREIYGELTGYFLQAAQIPEYIELAGKQAQLEKKLEIFLLKTKEKIYEQGDPYADAKKYLMQAIGVSGEALFDETSGGWRGSYYTKGGKRQLDLLKIGDQRYRRLKDEIEKRTGVSEESIHEDIQQVQDQMNEVRYKKNKELQLSNTMQEAWTSLGKAFSNAVKIAAEGARNHAKDAFSKHYEKSFEMAEDDFSWTEKKTGGNGSTGPRKTQFELLVADHIVRKGGRDVKVESTEGLKKAFNLRDVQSGNWVLNDPKSAKFHVDNIAMGLADMGDILGIPDDLLSLNGRLAIAIGARGHSKALAHYEPVERVINITKMKGGGSLGHEWFHAFDNLIAEAMTGGKYNLFLTESGDHYELTARQEKLIGKVKFYKQQRDYSEKNGNSGNEEYYSKRYEEAKKAAKKAGVAVDELENQEDHILKVKAAFNKLVTAMRTGSATKTKDIIYTKDDYEAALKFFDSEGNRDWIGLKEGMTIDEALSPQVKRGRGFRKMNPERLEKFIAAWLDRNPKGGALVAQTDKTTSSFYEESKRLDTSPGKPYWSKIIEMGARAFSSYLNDKMVKKGWENNYLAHATDNEQYGGKAKPYPDGEEREAINTAFDDLFSVIRETKAIRKAIMMENTMKKAGYFSDAGLKELLNETSGGEVVHDIFHIAKGKDGNLGLFLTRILAKKQKNLSHNEVIGGDAVLENVLELEKSQNDEEFEESFALEDTEEMGKAVSEVLADILGKGGTTNAEE
jgi:hypothetical protein